MDTAILRKLIAEKNISVTELARRTGIPKSTINSWLQGVSPNIDQLYDVAKFFNVSLEHVAFGKAEIDPFERLFEKVDLHVGQYEVTVKKIVRKGNT